MLGGWIFNRIRHIVDISLMVSIVNCMNLFLRSMFQMFDSRPNNCLVSRGNIRYGVFIHETGVDKNERTIDLGAS